MLELHRHQDARAFLTRAEPWLLTREIEHAGVLQSARQARADDRGYERPIYWATLEDAGQLVGCAYRTPPFKVGVTILPDAAIAPLVADLAATYPGSIGGFSGPDPTVTTLASAPFPVLPTTWYQLRFDAVGKTLRAYVNGVLLLETSDDTLVRGNSGPAMFKAAADFDDYAAYQP